jgi:maltose O-acetyltransferase
VIAAARRLLLRLRGFPDPDRLRACGLDLGRDVYLGHGTVLDSGFLWLISIGDGTTLSAGVRVLAHDASMKRHVGYTKIARVAIGRHVYVGAGAIILPGVAIGDGAIVGAASVVTRDVAPGAVVAGNPARPIGTTREFVERHRLGLMSAPRYAGDGWTLAGGISPRRMREMRERLGARAGYVD